MMGLGSYGGGGFPPSSSSNLSALAPSFTVDQFLPKPNSGPPLDLTRSPSTSPVYPSMHDWVASHYTPYSRSDPFTNPSSPFDSTPSSDPYAYPGTQVYDLSSAYAHSLYPASPGALLFNKGSTIPSEAKPHYPSYVPPETHNYSPFVSHHLHIYDLPSASSVGNMNGHDHCAQSLPNTKFMQVPFPDGSWEGLVDLNQGEPGRLTGRISKEMNSSGSSFYKNHTKQVHASEGEISCQFAHLSNIHGAAKEKQIESASREQSDDKSFLGKQPLFMPLDHSAESVSGSTLLLPENYPQAPSLAVNSWSYRMRNADSFTEFMGQHGTHLNDDTSVVKSSTGLNVRPSCIDSYSIAHIPGSSKNVNIGAAHTEVANSDPSIVKEPCPFVKPEGKVHNNAQPLWSYLKQNNQSYAETSSAKELKSSNYSDLQEDFFHSYIAKSGVLKFNICKNGSDMTVDDSKSINTAAAHSSSEILDPYNPVVDLPCWKEASLSSFSLLDTSEAMSKECKEEIGTCKGSDLQGPKRLPPSADDAANAFSHRSTKRSVCHVNENPRNRLAYSLKRHSDVSLLFTENGIADTMKDNYNSNHAKPSCAHTHPCFEDTSEPRKEFLPCSKSVDDSDYVSSHLMQHVPGEIKLTSGIHAPADVANDEILVGYAREDNGSSHVALHASENVSCSTSPVANAPSELNLSRLCDEESYKELYVQTLVNSMVNFSELLLLHCSIDACHLREQHHKALKTVMNNLGKCIPKNAQHMESTGESMVTEQATSKFFGELPEFQKGISAERPMVLEATATDFLSQLDPQLIQKEEKCYFVPNKKKEKHSDFVSVRGDADVANHVNMTQAIKKVLSECFHEKEGKDEQVLLYKNLWLEAEASLCSLNCISRFNRIKTEVEKCNFLESKENACTEKLPNYQVYLDPATVNTSAPQAQDGPTMNRSPVISTSSHTDDVMARFFILKSRNGHSDSMKIPDEIESSFQDSPHLNIVDKLASEVKDDTSNTADDILARFRVIKSHVEQSNSMNITVAEKLASSIVSPGLNEFENFGLDVKDSLSSAISIQGYPIPSQTSHEDDVEVSVMSRFDLLKCRVDNSSSMDMENVIRHWPFIKDMSDLEIEAVLQDDATNFTKDTSTSKGFSLQVKDDHVIQPSSTSELGDQLPAGWYDGCSSDWELVLQE
ncbi:uncharacterized protein LOC119984416 isoform X2 [Tripterygium wilfordii]|uniref:uncharacterized protein LOC119984416 isoform X2 n=1 Tax=Tripterygium wilfordii TaxID=458696 RepID=UPI0018F836A9|nr:uncharacterized protein LOC119984416 isoform X2 [Tripterygium wilfordii]